MCLYCGGWIFFVLFFHTLFCIDYLFIWGVIIMFANYELRAHAPTPKRNGVFGDGVLCLFCWGAGQEEGGRVSKREFTRTHMYIFVDHFCHSIHSLSSLLFLTLSRSLSHSLSLKRVLHVVYVCKLHIEHLLGAHVCVFLCVFVCLSVILLLDTLKCSLHISLSISLISFSLRCVDVPLCHTACVTKTPIRRISVSP